MNFDFLRGATILVTGGTGSFGQKYVQTLLRETEAKKIIIFSRDELKQSQMQAEIPDPDRRLRYFIGDIRDLQRLERAFHGVDYVVHAAALKQVPALEYNPFEAVKTNIIGTQNVINAAVDQGVKKTILISSDKAANPANLYGATKLCAEKLFVNGNMYGAAASRFSVVRYGNVFGSRGSILNVIEKQRASGVLTLTHEEMTRFWITLEQGVHLVMAALANMYGGEIFVPKIPSMKVFDLMKVLAPECHVQITGIRPGEKLHEVLVTQEEARHTREYEDYYVIFPENDESVRAHYDAHHLDGKGIIDYVSLVSDTNTNWLDAERLKSLLQSL